MPKIRAKQLNLAAPLTATNEALDIAALGITDAHINDVDGSKIAANSVAAAKLSQTVLNMINRGSRQREAVLIAAQFIGGASGGIAPALALVLSDQPADASTLTLSREAGVTSETYTFKDAPAGGNDVQIGGSVNATLVNLAAKINANPNWDATLSTDLDDIDANVLVISRGTAVAEGSEDDRAYASASANCKGLPYAGDRYDGSVSTSGVFSRYVATDLVDLPTTNGGTNFGFGRALAGLVDGDFRFAMSSNEGYVFDQDSNTWNLGSGQAIADGSITTAKLAATSVTAAKLGSDVAGNGLTGGNGSALAVLAANTSVSVGAGGVQAAVPVTADKAGNPSGAVTTDETTTGLTITKTPAAGSYVTVRLNGVAVEVGNGVKTKDCYFSADAGVTARAFSAIVATDTLYWNAVIAGINLATTDEIDLDYCNTTA